MPFPAVGPLKQKLNDYLTQAKTDWESLSGKTKSTLWTILLQEDDSTYRSRICTEINAALDQADSQKNFSN